MYQFNKVLINYGDYDFMIYDVSDEDYQKMSNCDSILQTGIVNRIGIASTDETNLVSYGIADENAYDMLSICLINGRYPEKENEIAASKEYLIKAGIQPVIGNTIEIELSGHGEKTNNQEFQIVGIFDKYRYVDGNKEIKWLYQDNEDSADFSFPEIYLANNTPSLPDSSFDFFKNAVVFNVDTTGDRDDYDIYYEIQGENGELGFLCKYFNDKAKICHNSRLINDLVLNWSSNDTESANTMGYNNITNRISDGTIKKDFLTIVILPLLSASIIIIAICSVISAMKTSIFDRKERFKTLSILGMSAKQMIICMSLELLMWSFIGTILGVIFGNCIYYIALIILHDFPSAYDADKFIKAITLSPYPFIFLFILLYVVLGFFFILISIKSKNKSRITKKNNRIHGSISAIYSLQKSDKLMRKNSIFSKIIIVTLSFSVVISYVYVTECQKNDSSYQNYDYPYGNYYAERNYYQCKTDDYFENHHDSGINYQYLEDISHFNCVNGVYASIINCSSKLVYNFDDPIAIKLNKKVNDMIQKGRYLPDDIDYDSDVEILNEIGYASTEQLFCTPTIGLSDEYLEVLKQYVTFGEINIEKIKSGEEVVLLQSPLAKDDPLYAEYKKAGLSPPSDSFFDLTEVFSIGDELPLSDIIYDTDTDLNNEINSNNLIYYQIGRNAFRQDFSSKIGAIVKIDDDNLRNLISYMGCDGKLPFFNIICSYDSFSNWNLPDKNFSRMYADVSPRDDFLDFETFWNKMSENVQKTNMESSFDILNSIQEVNRLNSNIFFTVFLVLFTNGILGIIFTVSYSCRLHHSKFTQLYQLGIKKRYFYLYESMNLLITIIISQITMWGVFALIQFYMSELQRKMDEYLSSHMSLEGRLLYLSELLPMKATWFRMDLLLKPTLLLACCLIIIILFTIVIQFHNIRIRRKTHG